MRKITILLLLLFSSFLNSQELSENKIEKLHNLNIDIEKLDFKDVTIQNNLNEVLRLDRKHKTNKTVAIVLTSIAASGIVLGAATYSKKGLLGETLGGILIISGTVYGGVSIPFWIASTHFYVT